MMDEVNLRYIISAYVNITVYPLYNYYIVIKFKTTKTKQTKKNNSSKYELAGRVAQVI
jgi:predicted ATP-binding protein involved in virulence